MQTGYTVKQLSTIAGVTIRTLHYYDEIGLLKPSAIGGNGYRYYDEEALLRLQQILFYRELEVPLEDIRKIVAHPDFDVLGALETHRAALQAELGRIRQLIRTIDRTSQHLKGKVKMSPTSLFEGFSEEEQAKLAEEAAAMWDAETVNASNQKWRAYSQAEKRRILEEGKAVHADLIAAKPHGAASKQVQAVVARWHAHLQHFWSPSDAQLLGLADLYNDDPRFRANYEKAAPGLAAFVRDAVKVYVKNRRK